MSRRSARAPRHRGAAMPALGLLAACAAWAAGPYQSPGTTVIKDATILTVSHGNIARGSIVIRDGKIVEVGPAVAIPAGAAVIDGTNQFVMPGIIDPQSHMAERRSQRGQPRRHLDDRRRGRARPDRHRHLPRPRRRRDHRDAAREREPDRRDQYRDQAAVGARTRKGSCSRGETPRPEVRPRREPEALAHSREIPGYPDGRRGRHPAGLHRGAELPAGLGSLPQPGRRRQERDSAARKPGARTLLPRCCAASASPTSTPTVRTRC